MRLRRWVVLMGVVCVALAWGPVLRAEAATNEVGATVSTHEDDIHAGYASSGADEADHHSHIIEPPAARRSVAERTPKTARVVEGRPGRVVPLEGATKNAGKAPHHSAGGHLLSHIAIHLGVTTFHAVHDADSATEGFEHAVDVMKTPEFIVGELMMGIVGATIGEALPLPGFLAGTGLMGMTFRALPPLFLANLAGRLGAKAVHLIRNDDFSWHALFQDMHWGEIMTQTVGAALGAAVGTALIPIPILGPVIGGIAGSMAAVKLVEWLGGTSHGDDLEDGAHAPATAAGAAGAPEDEVSPSNAEAASTASLYDMEERVRQAYASFLEASEDERADALQRYRAARDALSAYIHRAVNATN